MRLCHQLASLSEKHPGDTEGKRWTASCKKRKVSLCQLCKLQQQLLQPLHQLFFCYCTWSFATIHTENSAVLRVTPPSFQSQYYLPPEACQDIQPTCLRPHAVCDQCCCPSKSPNSAPGSYQHSLFCFGKQKTLSYWISCSAIAALLIFVVPLVGSALLSMEYTSTASSMQVYPGEDKCSS